MKDQGDILDSIHRMTDDEVKVKRVRYRLIVLSVVFSVVRSVVLNVPVSVQWSSAPSAYLPV